MEGEGLTEKDEDVRPVGDEIRTNIMQKKAPGTTLSQV